jgi:hypothetical protein
MLGWLANFFKAAIALLCLAFAPIGLVDLRTIFSD